MLTLKVGHESLCAAVQSVDDHLSVRGTSDLYPPVLEAWRGRRTDPGRVCTDVSGLGGKVERDARVEALLGDGASSKKSQARRVEGAVEGGEELEGVLGKDLGLGLLGLLGEDLHACNHGERCVECWECYGGWWDGRCGRR